METNASSSAGKLNLWRNKKKMQFSVIGKLIAKPPATITQFQLIPITHARCRPCLYNAYGCGVEIMVSGGQQVSLANCQFLYRAFHNAWRNSIKFAATVCHFGHCFYGPNKRQTKLKSINKSWRLRPGIVSAIQLADGRLWANWFRSQLLWYSVSSSSSFRLLSQLCGVFVLVLVRENRKNSVTVEAATDNRPHEMYSPKDGGHDPRVWIHFSISNANLKQLKDTGGRT